MTSPASAPIGTLSAGSTSTRGIYRLACGSFVWVWCLVYFEKWNLQAGLRFVDAAWRLDQHGEMADHLARIFEAQGHKDQAIPVYAQAIAAPHSVPETRARLTLLLGGNSKIDDLVAQARPELTKMRAR